MLQPLLERRGSRNAGVRHLAEDRGLTPGDLVPTGAIFFSWNGDDGRRIGNVVVHHLLRGIAEEGAQRVEVALGYRVKLMIVTSGTTDGHAQEHGAHSVGAVLGINLRVFV